MVTAETFSHHSTTDLTNFDSDFTTDLAAPKFFRLKKTTTMEELVQVIAETLGHDPKRARLWIMVNRQNKTTRPDQPIMDLKPTIEETYARCAGTSRDFALRVWLELAEDVDDEGNALWPTYQGNANGVIVKNDLILLFLKYFDVEKQSLRGVGHIYVSKEKKVEELTPIIAKKMGWGDKLPAGEQLHMWEEIKPSMIETLKPKQSLKAAELQDGDIVCFQKVPDKKSGEILGKINRLGEKNSEEVIKRWDRFDDAKEFYDFLMFKRDIRFDPHPRCEKENLGNFILTLSSKINYDQLAERVGEHLQVEPTHLRFFTVNASTGAPKSPIRRAVNMSIAQLLNPNNYHHNLQAKPDSLFYEVLDMSLAEYDMKKNVKVCWLSEGVTKAVSTSFDDSRYGKLTESTQETYDVLVNKQGHIEDLIQAFIKKAQIKDEREGGRIRVYESHNHKIFRELPQNYPVLSTNDYADLIAERIPEEEADAEDREFIKCFHFQADPSRAHGIPFKFLLIEVCCFGVYHLSFPFSFNGAGVT